MSQVEVEGRGGLLFNVNLVFFSQIVIYGLAFALRVILARGLGDSGLGTFALFFNAVLVAGGVANLGVGLGSIYFLNKGTYSYGVLLSGSVVVFATTSAAGWVLLAGYGVVAEPSLFVSSGSYWLYGVAVPATVAYVLLTAFLHGASRFAALSVVAVTQGAVSVASAGSLYLVDELDVLGAVAAWGGSFVIADLVALGLVGLGRIDLPSLLRPRWDVLREQIRYGAQGQIANLTALFNYRLDQFLVAGFVSRAGVGHYTVAVGLGESVWWLSSSVALVLQPRLTQMDREEAGRLTPVACRNTMLVSALGGVALVIVSPVAIRLLFGGEFDPAVLPLILLMPGIVAASATRVLGSYLYSQGRVIYNTYATLIALGVTISLDLALIPWLEVEGAAIASSIAYSVALVATLYWYRLVSGGGVWEALVIQRGDLRRYREVWERVTGRLAGRADDDVARD